MGITDNVSAIIDRDEFKETVINFERIKKGALAFVEEYIAHVQGKYLLHPAEFSRRYSFSTLPYFHKELGIE